MTLLIMWYSALYNFVRGVELSNTDGGDYYYVQPNVCIPQLCIYLANSSLFGFKCWMYNLLVDHFRSTFQLFRVAVGAFSG